MHDDELDRFKRDIHFVQYAASRYGYVRDSRESSRASHVLRQPSTDDKLVVRQNADGHWTYFSVRDDRDNGTIVDFVQRRARLSLGDTRKELRQWLGTSRPEFDQTFAPSPRPAPIGQNGPIMAAVAFAAAKMVDNSLYLNARGIRPETLRDVRFAGTWRQDARKNALFAHVDEGKVTGFEIKNRGFTGFSPSGLKTAWTSAARPQDRTLVITESAVDALSHHQLHREGAPLTRYASTAGLPSSRQLEVFDRTFARLAPGTRVVAAVDADAGGTLLAKKLELLASRHLHLTFERDSPAMDKDWNDVLKQVERAYIRSLPSSVRALAVTQERSR